MGNIHPLKAYRRDSSLTQQGLADLVNVKRTTVARWETGARKIDQAKLDLVSEKTGIAKRDLRPDLAELLEPSEAAQ